MAAKKPAKKKVSKKKATTKKVTKKTTASKKTTGKKVYRKRATKKKPIEIVGELMPKPGQPTKYHKDLNYAAYKLALVGMTDIQMAEVFSISERTINNWKHEHPGFLQSIQRGKALADGDVSEKLLHRALGYTHEEEKVFCFQGEIITHVTQKHYPPDTAAALGWLQRRQPEKWGNKVEVESNRPLQEYTLEELRQLQRRLLRERRALGVDDSEDDL